MIAHNLGYPRIGSQRELKKANENYWSGKISLADLQAVAPPYLASKLKDCHGIQSAFFLTIATVRGQNPEARRLPDDPYNFYLFDLAGYVSSLAN